MIFPALTHYVDIALLLLRLMIGLIFFTSGWTHLTNAEARSRDIGSSKAFTLFLGAAECAGALGVAFGVLTQLAAIGLILLMLGAIQKKIATWRTGFWGKHGTDGWSYDLIMILMMLVILTTAGGNLALENLHPSIFSHCWPSTPEYPHR
jgi:putative oxidoreductase